MDKINVAILASGSGSNAENICHYFQEHKNIRISWIASNRKDAYVLERAKRLGIPHHVFSKAGMEDGSLGRLLEEGQVSVIVLAGFLLKIPETLIESYPESIINIHPSLLPSYGGKGMYGQRVHEAVIAAGDRESGITIHLVNREYDKGRILFQARCEVSPEDTAETLAAKIHDLEYRFFPKVIADYILHK